MKTITPKLDSSKHYHPTATKFLVISYDDDQQQTFWDWVLAVDADHAEQFVATHRPYVTAITDAISYQDLSEAADRLAAASISEIADGMKERVSTFVSEEGGYE